MKKALLLLILLLPSFLSTTCHKNDDDFGLPPATQTGANTFGCLIDGKPWVADIAPNILDPAMRKLDMSYDETLSGVFYNNTFALFARLVNDTTSLSFAVTGFKLEKPGLLDVALNKLSIRYRQHSPLVKTYEMNETLPYKYEITKLDTLANICSGRFEFYVISSDKSDTLHITEGRFDKKYSPE